MDDLKACPFCGGEGKLVEVEESGYVVECQNGVCGASTNVRYSCGDDARPLVIEQWNRRPALSRPAGGEWVMVPREPTPEMLAAPQTEDHRHA